MVKFEAWFTRSQYIFTIDPWNDPCLFKGRVQFRIDLFRIFLSDLNINWRQVVITKKNLCTTKHKQYSAVLRADYFVLSETNEWSKSVETAWTWTLISSPTQWRRGGTRLRKWQLLHILDIAAVKWEWPFYTTFRISLTTPKFRLQSLRPHSIASHFQLFSMSTWKCLVLSQ